MLLKMPFTIFTKINTPQIHYKRTSQSLTGHTVASNAFHASNFDVCFSSECTVSAIDGSKSNFGAKNGKNIFFWRTSQSEISLLTKGQTLDESARCGLQPRPEVCWRNFDSSSTQLSHLTFCTSCKQCFRDKKVYFQSKCL